VGKEAPTAEVKQHLQPVGGVYRAAQLMFSLRQPRSPQANRTSRSA
jgi:hypothetical protein